jgi:hypothetical protein
MIEQKVFSRFHPNSSETLSHLSLVLYEQQKKTWLSLSDGISSLKGIQTRHIECKTFAVNLQFNPKRIVSSGAKVDEASIKSRKCFLCIDNLPKEQLGVLYREKFFILSNPMPIFERHFTISHIDHIPQSIEEHIITLLDLSKDFSESHTIFYNGPKCGASAPDHMHFQANPKGSIPVEYEARSTERRKYHKRIGEVSIFSLADFGRGVILLESKKKQAIEFCFLRLTGAMRSVLMELNEPMMNVLCSYSEEGWRIFVFPRTKHRPDVYFKKGEENMMISPAAIDLGGLIIMPIEKDFRTIDAKMIEGIFHEVSIGNELLETIIEKM